MSDALLDERGKTHGDMGATARTYNALGDALWEECTPEALEDKNIAYPLDMILVKLARIACGDYRHEDHWRDIAGYAEMGRRLTRE